MNLSEWMKEGLLAALVTTMILVPAFSTALVQPPLLRLPPHRGNYPYAGLVANPTGTQIQEAEFNKVYEILGTYMEVSPVGLKGESATTQRFYDYIALNLPYYHFVGVGILESSTPRLQFYNPDYPEQSQEKLKNISPRDLWLSTDEGSLSGTLQVVLSCCFGMWNWREESYETSFAWVFIDYLGAYSVVGSECVINDLVALVFTIALYDEIFNGGLTDDLNMAYTNALQRTNEYFSLCFDVVWELLGFGLGVVASILFAILSEGMSLPASPWIIEACMALATLICTYSLGQRGKAQYLTILGIPFLVQKIRPPEQEDSDTGDTGSNSGEPGDDMGNGHWNWGDPPSGEPIDPRDPLVT